MNNNEKMVVLLSPASRSMNHYRPPLALMYISGYLKRCGVKSKIIDVNVREQVQDAHFRDNRLSILANVEDEILKRLALIDTDFVGITCYSPEYDEVKRLSARVRTVKPDALIVIGGVHPTLYPEHFTDGTFPADYVVVGEGELTMLELVKSVRSGGGNISGVAGIGYFDKTAGKPVVAQQRAVGEDLDEIAYPDFEDLDMDYYTTAAPYSIRGVFARSFYISSSRGCPSSCTFCVAKKLRSYHGAKHFARLRSPKSLFREIMELREKHNIDSFYFVDDLFTLNKANVSELCRMLKENGNHLIWGCSSKVNTVDEETMRLMRDSGCVQIDFGVEKGSDRALKSINKGITVEQIKRTFALCRKLGIRAFANILVNTPGETDEDLADILRLLDEIRATVVSVNVFTPYPGCEIFDVHCSMLGKEDYPLLMGDPVQLTVTIPEKFRFAAHNADFGVFVQTVMKRYNRALPNLAMFFDARYLNMFLRSKRKSDYVRQLGNLFKEYLRLRGLA